MMRFALVLLAVFAGLSLTMGRVSLPAPKVAAEHKVEVAQIPIDRPAASASVGQELMLARDGSGQFHVDITLNGQSIPFLVDTGADSVALTIESARQAGFYVDPTGFETVAVGASGPVRGSRITIAHLEVAGRTLENVDGMVLEGLGTNLLGQNVLGRLGAVELSGDTMRIR